MEKIVQNYLLLFLLGLGAVVTFQNTFLSIKKSFARNYGKTSDILRIICNFGNLSRFLLSIGYFMTPSDVTSTSCKALGYMYLISYHLLRESFFAFMLWTLYRMSSERKDLWIGVTFLLIQTSLLIPTLIFVQPVSILMTSPNQDNQVHTKQCDLLLTNQTLMKLELPKTILEMTMVIYVIFQLIYLKLYRNRRVAVETPTTCETTTNNTVTSTTATPNVLSARRPLKSSTVYWTATLAALIFILNLSFISKKPEKIILLKATNSTLIKFVINVFLYIFISCIITYFDSEKKNVIFYNCSRQNGNVGSGNLKNSSNQLDGEAWVICSKKERKKNVEEEKVVEKNTINNV